MNLSDGGIEAFRLTMNCAIGISLGDRKQRNCNHVSTTVKGGRNEGRNKNNRFSAGAGAYQEMNSPLIALTILSVLWTRKLPDYWQTTAMSVGVASSTRTINFQTEKTI